QSGVLAHLRVVPDPRRVRDGRGGRDISGRMYVGRRGHHDDPTCRRSRSAALAAAVRSSRMNAGGQLEPDKGRVAVCLHEAEPEEQAEARLVAATHEGYQFRWSPRLSVEPGEPRGE